MRTAILFRRQQRASVAKTKNAIARFHVSGGERALGEDANAAGERKKQNKVSILECCNNSAAVLNL